MRGAAQMVTYTSDVIGALEDRVATNIGKAEVRLQERIDAEAAARVTLHSVMVREHNQQIILIILIMLIILIILIIILIIQIIVIIVIILIIKNNDLVMCCTKRERLGVGSPPGID